METDYLANVHRSFGVSEDDRLLFEGIIDKPAQERGAILEDLHILTNKYGLAYGLLALYRQQVTCGFVLGDPLNPEGKEVRHFADPETGIVFGLMWNPDRELRKDHRLLIQRGVVAEHVDASKLINLDKAGKPCYLCKENIALQNPGEVLLPLQLAGEEYFAGANFAYITNNHFTLASSEHRPQRFSRDVLAALTDFVEQTDGRFRAIFNGLAGASILWHEHMQATTETFPIEEISIKDADVIHRRGDLRVSRPSYYVPLWVVEGTAKEEVQDAASRIVEAWHSLDRKHHTENIVSTKGHERFKVFVFLRDTRRLAGTGKAGAMASFECAGSIVLSYVPDPGDPGQTNERDTFESATLQTVRGLLRAIEPAQELVRVDLS